MAKIRSFLVIVWLFSSPYAMSQNITIDPVSVYDQKEVGGRVYSIYQDRMGFIWIGKATGLFRYDGYQMIQYRHKEADTNSISSDYVMSIYEDNSGYLWIGTKGGGLNRFDRETGIFSHYKHDEGNKASISFDEVFCIFPADSGRMWIGTDGGGFDYFDPQNGVLERFSVTSQEAGLWSDKILCFKKAGESGLYIGTWNGGLHYFDFLTKKIKHLGDATQFARINIFCIDEFEPGKLLLAAWGQGLISYDIKRDSFSSNLFNKEILSFRGIQKDPEGVIWAGSNLGILKLSEDGSNFQMAENALPSFTDVSCMFKDKTGTIWVGYENGSVGKINSFQKKISRLPVTSAFYGEPVHSVLASIKTDNVFYSPEGFLVTENKRTNEVRKLRLPYADLMGMLELPSDGLILCASSTGLGLFDWRINNFTQLNIDSTGYKEILNKQILAIHPDGAGQYWVGVQGGVYKIRPGMSGKWSVTQAFYSGLSGGLAKSHYSTSFQLDQKGNLYVGTWGGGLNVLPGNSDEFIIYVNDPKNNESISGNFIECLAEDRKGNIWVGTHEGLNIFNPSSGKFKRILRSDGLSNAWIKAITIDQQNRIWVSTMGGVSCVSENGQIKHNYDSGDGLPSNTFNSRAVSRDASGVIYFGSTNNLTWFHPDSLSVNPFIPDVLLTDFKINNDSVRIGNSSPLHKAIELTDEILLNYRQSSFSIQITPLSYFNSKKNRIKYRLEGYDSGWRTAETERLAKYQHIPAGKYKFTAIASNEDDVWNTVGKSIIIIVRKPFWQKGYSILIFILLISLSILFIRWYRNTRARAKIEEKLIGHEEIQPSDVVIESQEKIFVQKLIRIFEENISNSDFGVNDLCEKMSMSRPQLYRRVHSTTGFSVKEFMNEIRLKRAAQLLKLDAGCISEIAFKVGFNDPKYFSKCFKKKFGVSPVHFRQ